MHTQTDTDTYQRKITIYLHIETCTYTNTGTPTQTHTRTWQAAAEHLDQHTGAQEAARNEAYCLHTPAASTQMK